MKRFFSLFLSLILLMTASAVCILASAESATAQLQEMYAQGELLMAQGDYAGAATQFETLGAYSDASQMAMYCKGIMAAEDLGMFDVAVSAFQGLGDFKDSKQLITYYQGRSYQASADALIGSEERDDLVSAKNDYDEATKIYSELALFKDCLTRLSACQSGSVNAQDKIYAYDYAVADKLEQDGKYEEAIKAFKALGSYSDSTERVKTVQEKIYARDYAAADNLEQNGKYEEARKAFRVLGNYSDSTERVKTVQEKIYARDYAAADNLEQNGKYEEARIAFKALGSYSDSAERAKGVQEKIYVRDYTVADNLEQNGKYEEAIEAFKALGSYSDSAERAKGVQEKIYVRDYTVADNLEQDGKYEEAIEAFKALGSYSDSVERAKGVQEKIYVRDYAVADNLEQDGKYEEAIEAFKALGSYSDSVERAKRITYRIIGNYVTFGTYPQTKTGTDSTPIEWLILDVQGNKSLLISRYALDCEPYNEKFGAETTWEQCTLRSWLNKDFINRAFTEEEKVAIIITDIDNSNSQGYSGFNTLGGNNTRDKIFLLSYAEAWKYFAVDAARKCIPTDYALSQGKEGFIDFQPTGTWWYLRSPGYFQAMAATVDYDGTRDTYGKDAYYTFGVVRPAFWLDLESEIF